VRLKDGSVHEERQAHFRGGAHEPLSRADLEEKFRLNCAHGGWPAERAAKLLELARNASRGQVDLRDFRA
jgi:2-methylcitrate dehydratase PrpD